MSYVRPSAAEGEDIHEPQSVLGNPEDILLQGQGQRTNPVLAFDFTTVQGGVDSGLSTLLKESDSDASKGDRPQGLGLGLQRVLESIIPNIHPARHYRDEMFESQKGNLSKSDSPNLAGEDVCWACSSCVKRNREQEDAVRGLIGVERESLLGVGEEIEKLRRVLNPTREEIMKAARSVEQLIGKHFNTTMGKNQDDTVGDVSSSRLEDVGISALGTFKYDTICEVGSFESVKSEKGTSVEELVTELQYERVLTQNELKVQDEGMRSNKSVDCLAVTLDDDCDDEMNVEESRMFLEYFKIDNERRAGNMFCDSNVLILETEVNSQEIDLHKIEECNILTSTESVTVTEPKIYFPPMESNSKQEIRCNITEEQHGSSSLCVADEQKDKLKLSRLASTWGSSDSCLAKEILNELKQAVEWFGDQHAAETSNSAEQLEEMSTKHNVAYFERSIEQVGIILSNLSEKIRSIFLEENNDSSNLKYTKGHLHNVANILFTCLDYAVDSTSPVKDENQLMASIEEVLDIFSFMSELLNKVPPDMKHESIAILNPPESLTKALALLGSTEYFKSCFVTGVQQESNNKEGRNSSAGVEMQSNDIILRGEGINTDLRDKKSCHMLNQKVNTSLKDQTIITDDSKTKLRRFFPLSSQSPDDAKHHLNCFEDYSRLPPAFLTVGDFSNMLLLMSSVLNEFPSELKSAIFSDLNPPSDLLQGMAILYEADDIAEIVHLERRKGFLTLTLQEVSDFMLTLSKILHQEPLDVKNSKSLVDSMVLLTSLLHKPKVSPGQDEVHEVQDWSTPASSQEHFFDAIDSISCLN